MVEREGRFLSENSPQIKGTPRSPEIRDKISQALMGRTLSPETRAKMSQAQAKRRKNMDEQGTGRKPFPLPDGQTVLSTEQEYKFLQVLPIGSAPDVPLMDLIIGVWGKDMASRSLAVRLRPLVSRTKRDLPPGWTIENKTNRTERQSGKEPNYHLVKIEEVSQETPRQGKNNPLSAEIIERIKREARRFGNRVSFIGGKIQIEGNVDADLWLRIYCLLED